MVWDGGTPRQKPNRGQSDEHRRSSVCHVALPSCPGEAINVPIEYLSIPSAMVWLWVTVVASRRACRTCLCTVPWTVLGNQCTEGCQCPPSWEELRFGISPIWGWNCKGGWFCPYASSILALALMMITSESHHNVHCVAAKLLCVPCKNRGPDMMLTKECCAEWKWSRNLLSWVEHK